MIRDWIESPAGKRGIFDRWFGMADLACASVSGALCYSQPGLGGWPLLIALIPWTLRLAVADPLQGTGHFPLRRTSFDLPLLLFVITAAIGVWAAYDRDRAWAKFWVIAAAAVLYYALASQPRANLWFVAGVLILLGVYVAVYFLLTHDWEAFPADTGLLNRLGLRWMRVRPELPLHPIYDNIAGGLLAMLVPFSLAMGLRAWHERRVSMGVFALVTGGLASASLLMTSSRSAWLALAVAIGAWFLWRLSEHIAWWTGRSRGIIFCVIMLAVSGPGVWYALSYPGGPAALANKLLDLPNGASRLDLARDTFHLTQDFVFTGGGLGAFSGLYSRYGLIIPVFLFGYSHNFLLDVALEQGVFGGLALVIMILGSAGILIAQIWRERDAASHIGLLRWAILAGLIVVGLHGLLGDALYGEGGTPLLFLFTGMAVAMRPHDSGATRVALPAPGVARRWTIGIAAAMAGGAVLLVACYRPLLSSWYADLGAVQMARIELAGWRDDVVNDPGAPDLSSANVWFNRALQVDPDNRTAHFRLGLIAYRDRDFTAAAAHLETVYQFDHGHRGVNKVLGYDYVWLGQFDRAAVLLSTIPEAGYELGVYAWWWGTQEREDLAERAGQMAVRLESVHTGLTP